MAFLEVTAEPAQSLAFLEARMIQMRPTAAIEVKTLLTLLFRQQTELKTVLLSQ